MTFEANDLTRISKLASSPSACCLTTIENDFSVGRFLPWNKVLQLATTEERFRHRKVYSLQVLDNDLREANWECCTISCILFSLFLCVIHIGNFSRASVDLHFFNLDIHLLLPLNTVLYFYTFLIERGFASCRIRVRLSLEYVVSYSRDTPAVQAHGFDFHHSSNSSDDRIPNRLYFH